MTAYDVFDVIHHAIGVLAAAGLVVGAGVIVLVVIRENKP